MQDRLESQKQSLLKHGLFNLSYLSDFLLSNNNNSFHYLKKKKKTLQKGNIHI